MKIFPYKMHISNYYTYYGIIYGIVNTINNKIYIGKTTKKFDVYLEKHFKNAIKQKNNSKYLYRAIRKYKEENFKIIIFCYCFSEKELNKKEIYYIGINKSNNKLYGYNLTPGGDGVSGRYKEKNPFYKKHHTKETIEYLSKYSINLWKEEEYRNNNIEKNKQAWKNKDLREKQSNMVKALWEDENYRKKQVEKHKNFKQTEESKIKRSIKIKNLKWINKENVNKRVKKNELNIYLKNNWKLGRYKR